MAVSKPKAAVQGQAARGADRFLLPEIHDAFTPYRAARWTALLSKF